MRQEQHGLGDVLDCALSKKRLVVPDQRDHVAARDVAMVGDEEARRVEVQCDAANGAVRDGRAHGSPMKHAREGHVVGVPRAAGRLADPILAGDALADC